jgi:hypothetical protein
MNRWLLEFWRVEGVDRKTGIREQETGVREQGTGKNRQRQGQRPGAEARFLGGDGIAQAKAWAYLRNNGKAGVGRTVWGVGCRLAR